MNSRSFDKYFSKKSCKEYCIDENCVYLQLDCMQVQQFGCHNSFPGQANSPSLSSRRAFSGMHVP